MNEMYDNLWAPWRMEYIEGLSNDKKNSSECFLCKVYADDPKNDKDNLLLMRGKQCFVVMNRFPYNNGHLLVAPIRHVGEIDELSDDELFELIKLTKWMKKVIQDIMNPEGFNIGINLGHCAGAGLPGHLHIHIVPRWSGDTNYMTVIGKVKVIPEDLFRTYDKLASHSLIKKRE